LRAICSILHRSISWVCEPPLPAHASIIENTSKRWLSPVLSMLVVVGWLVVALAAPPPALGGIDGAAHTLKSIESVDAPGTRADPPRLQQASAADHLRDPLSGDDLRAAEPMQLPVRSGRVIVASITLAASDDTGHVTNANGPRAPPV
jgi:hypothetical protein